MTDFIDLATLAGLGQHFSSHEDVAELKESLASVQNELALIRGFLMQQYGSEFVSALHNEENVDQPKRKSPPAMVNGKSGNRQNSVTSAPQSISQEVNSGQQLQRPRPPPLQRFSRVTSSDEGSSLVGRNVTNLRNANAGTPPATVKSEKFHRNFLSISSLKGNRSTGGTGSLKRGAIFLNSVNGGSVKEEPEDCDSGSGRSAVSVYKMPRLKTAALQKVETTYDNEMDNEDEDYNVSEDAYAAVEVTEDGQFDETGEEDYAAYDEGGDYQEDGDYDDSMAYQDQEDDGTLYEDDYSMEGLQGFVDANGSAAGMVSNNVSLQLINGRRSTSGAIKKTQQRRLSLPAAATGGRMADANFSGSSDPNYLKKCKVCHEEVPSYSLFNHVVSAHYKGEVPTCTICKKTFTYKQGLISHMRYHDAEKYDKACSFCGKKFIRRSDVIIHERRLHTGERPFTCPVPDCNQGFVRRYCLLTHIKTNHGEPYVSQVAGDAK